MPGQNEITLGFMALLDSAILIAADALGFAESQGLRLRLVRETSWANIRDRVAVGHFDGAHMLAPMPIAFNLGLAPLSVPVVAPMALGLGGNAVTVSNTLFQDMQSFGSIDILAPETAGQALAATIARRRADSGRRVVFAVVHFHSGHNYELRYWLSACGIDPDADVEIVIVPPPLMPDALRTGAIDGYCVGEPWNSASVALGIGRIVTVKSAIWRSSPEKVLGLSQHFAEARPDLVERLIRALYEASRWCGHPANADALCRLLAEPHWLDVDPDLLRPALTGRIESSPGTIIDVPDFFLPHERAATFPWQSHALWFYSQMVRWQHAALSPDNAIRARDSYRPDLYRKALVPLGVPVPAANLKVEGALQGPTFVGASSIGLRLGPDGFFDGKIFDPDRLVDYLAG